MRVLKQLFDNNRMWAERLKTADPEFFLRLSRQQTPEYLWIGCSDSRVPANEIVGLLPGELFVHRNVANLVIHTDLNCQTVLEYAINVLRVKHIIVCGHYGCGGVKAALDNEDMGLIDNWLRHIKDVYRRHRDRFNAAPRDQLNLLCELNVVEQVANVTHSAAVQNAWRRGQDLTVHGWIYGIEDGLLRDLGVGVNSRGEVPVANGEASRTAILVDGRVGLLHNTPRPT